MAEDDKYGEYAEACELCPLCCNEMDATDRRFRPCRCGYQICAWCWHQLMELAAKDDGKGRCPACRTEYDEDSISFDAPPAEELNQTKKKKDGARVGATGPKSNVGIQPRKHLQNVRVIQRNLVYVVGLSTECCKEDVLRKNEFFGKYGEILKLQVSVNRQGSSSYAGKDAENTGSAYVTFYEEEDAMQCIQHIDGTPLDGRVLRACFGTTKYCNAFLKYQPCNNPDCLYLHDIGHDNDSFTKEEMLAHYGTKHQSFQEATRAISGGGLERSSSLTSLSSIPAPNPVRVPAPRLPTPAPPAGPPPPSAIGVGVPVATAWPSLGSSNSKPRAPLAVPPIVPRTPAPPPMSVAQSMSMGPAKVVTIPAKGVTIPAPRVPAPRNAGVCPVRPMASGVGTGWGQSNPALGVFGGPPSPGRPSADSAALSAAPPAPPTTPPPASSEAPKATTKNGFVLPQPRKIVNVASSSSQTDDDAALSQAQCPAGEAENAFPDALFTDAFNSSLDFDPSAVLRRHAGAATPDARVEQPRASRFGFALEAQSPGQCPVAHGDIEVAKNGESLLRALLPGANIRVSTSPAQGASQHSRNSSEGSGSSVPAPRRGPPPGFGGK